MITGYTAAMPLGTPLSSHLLRLGLMAVGWASVAVGLVGVVVPVLPTTPFLLVAVWAFARSSRRFHAWLIHHRVFGPTLAAWETHRVIPVRAKLAAVVGMAGGMVYVALFSPAPWYAAAAMGVVVAYGAWFVLSKPSRPGAAQPPDSTS